jgi:argininosuccinate lyase
MTTRKGLATGRFDADADPLFRAMNDSLPIDWRLVHQDIAGSKAWARALADAGVLTQDELARLRVALDALAAEAATITTPPVESGAEDVHTWVEQRLTATLGPLGKKLHTGRSRNDQVATDFRLWCREACTGLIALVRDARAALIAIAQREHSSPFPAYTHMQLAQPITFGHWCLAYEAMLARDAQRLHDARSRLNHCPLGCGALAGTAYPIDRERLARDLGFDAPCLNSLDAVADRDFVVDILAALALLGVHLSRMAEDLILFMTSEFGLIALDDSVTSGSSLMPQKKNPDACELLRGLSARVAAAHASMLMNLKGQPLAYNKDLQDDKRTLFDAHDTSVLCLRIAARVLAGLRVNHDRAREAAQAGHTNATDLADALVAAGVPFRDAHEQVGALVRLALHRGVALESLPDADLVAHAPAWSPRMRERLTLDAVLARRSALGGTAPSRVLAAAAAAEAALVTPRP